MKTVPGRKEFIKSTEKDREKFIPDFSEANEFVSMPPFLDALERDPVRDFRISFMMLR